MNAHHIHSSKKDIVYIIFTTIKIAKDAEEVFEVYLKGKVYVHQMHLDITLWRIPRQGGTFSQIFFGACIDCTCSRILLGSCMDCIYTQSYQTFFKTLMFYATLFF